jgi:hypothetical protein
MTMVASNNPARAGRPSGNCIAPIIVSN